MITSSLSANTPVTFSFKKLLPREHGSWALAFEPLALGLLAAFSPAGVWLAIAVAAAFLARRPWQLYGERSDARTAAIALGCVAITGLLVSIKIAGAEILVPLIAALPAGLVFLWYDAQRSAREAAPEIAGAAAFALVPASLALCAGLTYERAWILAILMTARAVPTVCVVRNYIRTRKGRASASARVLALSTSFAAVAAIAIMVLRGLCPPLALVFSTVFALRAVWLLGPWAPDLSAKKVGILESVFGATYVLALGALH